MVGRIALRRNGLFHRTHSFDDPRMATFQYPINYLLNIYFGGNIYI